jgi:glutamate-1-semialdehyde 2,1-aminomutase
MDAIRIARAATGRETVVKIMGAYHGHHDAVMVSVLPGLDRIGEAGEYASIPHGAGIPGGVAGLTVAVPFNDADAMEQRIRVLSAVGDTPACVIMEAAMTNLGLILPEEGYLERVRELTHEYGVVLIFDEVKTGLTVARGGAAERFGIQPDMVTVAKALGGGLPAGAIGGTREIMRVVESGSVSHTGTFNGNPLSMAAARASLADVLTLDGYDRLEQRNDQMVRGCQEVIERYGLPAYAVGVGAKGGVTFSDAPITDYESFKTHQDPDVTDLAWLYFVNRGILMSPEREEEWTVSVAHGQAEVESFVSVFERLVRELLA